MTETSAEPSMLGAALDRAVLSILRLYGALAFIGLSLVPAWFLPADDAVILFQYSRNLSTHGAITFLAGGPRVEGATDFAWMLLVAMAMRLGIDPYWFCAAANVICLALLPVLLLRLADLKVTAGSVLTLAGVTALFPQIFAAAAGFATLPDAVLLTLMVLCVVRGWASLAALSALVLCLFRPDGVVFALPLLAYLLSNRRDRGRCIFWLGAFFLLPGVIYFLWRWHYFGEFLPLPFLVKSDAQRVLAMFVVHSVRSSLIFIGFAVVLFVAAGILREGRNRWLVSGLMVVPTFFYWSLRLDQNIAYRFFYYLPLAAGILLALNWSGLQERRSLILRASALAWLLLIAMPLYRELRTFRDEQFANVKSIAQGLARLPRQGTLITSEAGFLPYFSGWPTVDAWGLNTPMFAHRFFQAADVGRLHADLVVVHPERTDSCVAAPNWLSNYSDRTWQHLTRNMIRGADGYELWVTSYGSEFYRQREHWKYAEGDKECWLLRRDSPLRDAIAGVLVENHAERAGR